MAKRKPKTIKTDIDVPITESNAPIVSVGATELESEQSEASAGATPKVLPGLYQKFFVTRTDGLSATGQKHAGCQYFVLDLNHDAFARDAVLEYIRRCRRSHPELAKDLRIQLATIAVGKLSEFPSDQDYVRAVCSRAKAVRTLSGLGEGGFYITTNDTRDAFQLCEKTHKDKWKAWTEAAGNIRKLIASRNL